MREVRCLLYGLTEDTLLDRNPRAWQVAKTMFNDRITKEDLEEVRKAKEGQCVVKQIGRN